MIDGCINRSVREVIRRNKSTVNVVDSISELRRLSRRCALHSVGRDRQRRVYKQFIRLSFIDEKVNGARRRAPH